MTEACKLVSRRNSQGSGMTWWIKRPDGSVINTMHASSGREKYKKDQMGGLLRKEQEIWEFNRVSVAWSGKKTL